MSVIIIRYKKTVRNLLCRFFSKILKDIIVKIDKNDKKKQFKTAKTVRFNQKTLTNSRSKSACDFESAIILWYWYFGKCGIPVC